MNLFVFSHLLDSVKNKCYYTYVQFIFNILNSNPHTYKQHPCTLCKLM